MKTILRPGRNCLGLFEVELGTPYRISDLELATRLSFFLWSSIPDDALLEVAAAGALHEPEVLERETRRLLADRAPMR